MLYSIENMIPITTSYSAVRWKLNAIFISTRLHWQKQLFYYLVSVLPLPPLASLLVLLCDFGALMFFCSVFLSGVRIPKSHTEQTHNSHPICNAAAPLNRVWWLWRERKSDYIHSLVSSLGTPVKMIAFWHNSPALNPPLWLLQWSVYFETT